MIIDIVGSGVYKAKLIIANSILVMPKVHINIIVTICMFLCYQVIRYKVAEFSHITCQITRDRELVSHNLTWQNVSFKYHL